jgi:hypothetical protein
MSSSLPPQEKLSATQVVISWTTIKDQQAGDDSVVRYSLISSR